LDLSKIKVSGDLCKKVLVGVVGQTANREELDRRKGVCVMGVVAVGVRGIKYNWQVLIILFDMFFYEGSKGAPEEHREDLRHKV